MTSYEVSTEALADYAELFTETPTAAQVSAFDAGYTTDIPVWLAELEYVLHELGHVSGLLRQPATKRYASYDFTGYYDGWSTVIGNVVSALPRLRTRNANEIHAAAVTWVALGTLGFADYAEDLFEQIVISTHSNLRGKNQLNDDELSVMIQRATRRKLVKECADEVIGVLLGQGVLAGNDE